MVDRIGSRRSRGPSEDNGGEAALHLICETFQLGACRVVTVYKRWTYTVGIAGVRSRLVNYELDDNDAAGDMGGAPSLVGPAEMSGTWYWTFRGQAVRSSHSAGR